MSAHTIGAIALVLTLLAMCVIGVIAAIEIAHDLRRALRRRR